MPVLEWWKPVVILCVSMLLSFLVSLINRLATSKEKREQLRAWNREVRDWRSELIRVKRSGDKKLLKKLLKKEKGIKQLESKVLSQSFRQMRVLPITMVLFLLVWLVLTGKIFIPFTPLNWQIYPGLVSGAEPVAYLPWLVEPLPLNLFMWYLICSMAFGSLFSRVLGVGAGATE